MARYYEKSERIEQIAKGLIAKHHTHTLGVARIACVMKRVDPEQEAKPPKSGRDGKRPKIAKARLIPAIYQLLTGRDFIIEVDERYWDLLSLEQQEALIDHALSHCERDAKGWYLRDHDVEEFRSILERHGFWRNGLEEFVTAASQRTLPFEPPRPKRAEPSLN